MLDGLSETHASLRSMSLQSLGEEIDPGLTTGIPCAYRKLYPPVAMMESAENWPCGELAESLDRPMVRRIFIQRQMCSEFIVITGVVNEDSTQMGVAEDDDVIEGFPADRSDEPLRMPILPG